MKILREEKEFVLYIENPPTSMQVGNSRWAKHDMNCIYKELPINEVVDYCDGLRVLTEKNLNRISKGHQKDGYIMISASREKYKPWENDVRTKKLAKYLSDNGYSYIQVYGGYKEDEANKASIEKSFIVYPYDIVKHKAIDFETFKSDLIDVASYPDDPNNLHFDQDSILICEPNENPYYYDLRSKEKDVEFNCIDKNDLNNNYFTAIKKWADSSLNRKNHTWDNGNPQRFSFTMVDKIDNNIGD